MILFDFKELSQPEGVHHKVALNAESVGSGGTSHSFNSKNNTPLEKIFGHSPAMRRVLAQIQRVAPTSASVLITGESGTGKEITATTIHQISTRHLQPFVAVNCGAISPQLIESELFGHEKGSFTGAIKSHRGVFERAHGGTLFLDEITEMPMDLQVKLLRVLETQRFVRVGGDHEQKADVRIIAATNRCPQDEVNAGTLREDLLYRLQVFPIELPPLRERHSDIRDLALLFLTQLNVADGLAKVLSDDAMITLERHSWPGNLRELRNVVQRAYIMADSVISEQHLPKGLGRPVSSVRQKGSTLAIDIGTSVAEAEKNLIFATLDQCHGHKSQAAHLLGVSLKTLYNRLRKYEGQSGTRSINNL